MNLISDRRLTHVPRRTTIVLARQDKAGQGPAVFYEWCEFCQKHTLSLSPTSQTGHKGPCHITFNLFVLIHDCCVFTLANVSCDHDRKPGTADAFPFSKILSA